MHGNLASSCLHKCHENVHTGCSCLINYDCMQNPAHPNVPRSTAGAVESLDGIKQHIMKLERRAQREALKPLF